MVDPRFYSDLSKANLSFHVELWSDDGGKIDQILSANASVVGAIGAYEAEAAERPGRLIRLRQGARVIRETRRGPN